MSSVEEITGGISFDKKVDYINGFLRENSIGPLPVTIFNGNEEVIDGMYERLKKKGEIGKGLNSGGGFEEKINRICEEINLGKIQCRLMDNIRKKGYTEPEARFFSSYMMTVCYEKVKDLPIGRNYVLLNRISEMVNHLPPKVPLWPTGYYG